MHRSAAWLAVASVVVLAANWAGDIRTQRPGHDRSAVTRPAERLRPPSTATPIRIEGEVTGLPDGEGGLLTVRIGGVVQQQVAATAGAFAVDVPGAPGTAMVSLEYTQPGVQFTSLLGSYARLVRLAAGDARLTRQECECTRVSAFSTGLQHVAEMMLGHAPRGDMELENAVRQTGVELNSATLALSRLAAEPDLLPESHETGLALLRDRPGFAAYLQETDFALLRDPDAALADLPAAAMADADVPARSAMLGPVLDVDSPSTTTATVLEREGNAFTLHGGVAGLGGAHLGVVEDDALVLVPEGEVSFVNAQVALCPSTFEQTEERWDLLRREMRRQWAGDHLEIWRTYVEHEVSYPDCPELANRVARSAGFVPVLDLADSRLLTSARRFEGSNALPVFCRSEDPHLGSELLDCSYAVHRFARNGVGEMLDLGDKVDAGMQPIQAGGRAAFSWAMGADGAMHVQAGSERARYWVVDGGDGTALGVVYVADADRETGHVSIAGYTTMIRVSRPDLYTPEAVVGAWGYATLDRANRPRIGWGLPRRTTVVRDSDGHSVQFADQNPLYVERWTSAWGRLYSTAYYDSECVAPSAECVPATVRYFRPLARVGDRIHGIEDFYTSNAGSYPDFGVSLGWSRPQFHERREMPGALVPANGRRIGNRSGKGTQPMR